MTRAWRRAATLPLRALWSPHAALEEAGTAHGLTAAVVLALGIAALGAAALPRLFALLTVSLAPSGQPMLDAHLSVLGAGLRRYVVADRLLPPPPFLLGGLMIAMFAGPILAGRDARGRGRGRAIASVLVAGAAPLLVQRLGELAVVLAAPADALVAGDVVRLPARFDVGVSGALTLAGVAGTGWLSVVAEAVNAPGVWVVWLWGWGLARLDRGAPVGTGRAATPAWPFVLAAAAYAVGYAVYALLFPYYLLLVMGVA
jgi:hypothetical protein